MVPASYDLRSTLLKGAITGIWPVPVTALSGFMQGVWNMQPYKMHHASNASLSYQDGSTVYAENNSTAYVLDVALEVS